MKLRGFQMQTPWLVKVINTPRNKYLVYMFLHVPKHWLSICYQIFMWMLIITCILVTMFMSINVGSVTEYVVLFWLDLSCLIIFTCEFALNVWASTVLPKYSDGLYGVYLMLINPLYIIDMAVIGVTIADVALDCVWLPLAAGLRGFRMIHFFQYRFVMIRLLWKAIWSERFQLMVSLYYCIIWVFSFGFLMYFIEQPFNDYFSTVANSVWWAVVTFTTVGYGNASPITTAGKIVTAFAMILGVWIFGLPAGIVGAALALKCEEETSTSGTLRQNFGAAMVQNAWKVYRIKKQEDRQQEGDPPLWVRLSPIDHSLQFTNNPNAPQADMREYFNPIMVKFIFLLKYYNYKRKFRLTEEINDSKNFYATYMQTSWQQTNMLLTLHNKMDHMYDSLNDTKQRLDQFERRRPTRAIDGDYGGPDGPTPPPEDNATSVGRQSTVDSGTSVHDHGSSTDTDKTKRDSPFVLLKEHRIPLHRLLRRQVRCWTCLYKKERLRKQKRQRQQSYELPQLEPPLVDLTTPRSSQHDLLL